VQAGPPGARGYDEAKKSKWSLGSADRKGGAGPSAEFEHRSFNWISFIFFCIYLADVGNFSVSWLLGVDEATRTVV